MRTNCSVCNVRLLHSDWFAALQNACFDVNCGGNPPYVAVADEHLTQVTCVLSRAVLWCPVWMGWMISSHHYTTSTHLKYKRLVID